MSDKKIYEAPSAELFCLNVQEKLLEGPTVSDTGYGYDDQGPIKAVSGDL